LNGAETLPPPFPAFVRVLVSLFHRERGWQVVQRALYDQEKARSRAILSWINWGEFFYIVKRRVGAAKAIDALRLLEQLPIELFRLTNPWSEPQRKSNASMRFPIPMPSALPRPNG
jgi:predicted nucleic acid-binding protein